MTGNELKLRRKNLELSQEKFAYKLGVTSGTVARWEQLGDNEIPSPLLELAIEGLEHRLKPKQNSL